MKTRRLLISIGAAAPLAFLLGFAGAALAGAGQEKHIEFDDVRRQTAEFMRYNRDIRLTPDQQRVFQQALDRLPAPCCRDRTATTCCCTCNQGRTWWGLTKHLIADKGLGADEVRRMVAEWFEFTHPDGANGDACYRGRCRLPFHQDGCGGMKEDHVVF